MEGMRLPNTGVGTYDPKQVILTIGGVPISGYADETFISIKRSNGAAFTKKRGADGSVERVNRNSYDFTVEITLQQTSNSNLVLDGFLGVDMASNSGVMPITVTDLSGASVFVAASAWVSEDPQLDFGTDTTSRKWVIETGPAVATVGGNVATGLAGAIAGALT